MIRHIITLGNKLQLYLCAQLQTESSLWRSRAVDEEWTQVLIIHLVKTAALLYLECSNNIRQKFLYSGDHSKDLKNVQFAWETEFCDWNLVENIKILKEKIYEMKPRTCQSIKTSKWIISDSYCYSPALLIYDFINSTCVSVLMHSIESGCFKKLPNFVGNWVSRMKTYRKATLSFFNKLIAFKILWKAYSKIKIYDY